jgi:prolyl-tRNA synthetase
VVRRDTGEKTPVALYDMRPHTEGLLEAMQHDLLDRALERRDHHIMDADTLDEAVEAAQRGWARLRWSTVGEDGEARLNDQGLSVRCLQRQDGSLPGPDDDPGELMAFVARAY